MTRNEMTDEQISQKLEELNSQDEVDDAHVVAFLGEPHIHVDYTNGAIGVVSPDGSSVSVYSC